MEEKEPESSQPSLWRQIPNSVKVGLGMMSLGAIGEMAATAKYTAETMYLNIANVVVVGNEMPHGMRDSTRNLAIGSLVVVAAGAVPYFKGLRSAFEQENQ